MYFLQVYKSEEVNRGKFSGFCNMSFDSAAIAQAHFVEKSHVQNPKQLLEEHDRVSPSGCQPKMGKILFISLKDIYLSPTLYHSFWGANSHYSSNNLIIFPLSKSLSVFLSVEITAN